MRKTIIDSYVIYYHDSDSKQLSWLLQLSIVSLSTSFYYGLAVA